MWQDSGRAYVSWFGPGARHMRAIGPPDPRLQPAEAERRARRRSSRRRRASPPGCWRSAAIRLPWPARFWGRTSHWHPSGESEAWASPKPRSSKLSVSWPLRWTPAALCAPARQVHNPFCWIEAARELISLSVAPPNFSPLDGRDTFTTSPFLPSSTFPTPSFSTLFSRHICTPSSVSIQLHRALALPCPRPPLAS
jgi:hypothetical protein